MKIRLNSIRTKLIVFFIAIILFMSIISVISYYVASVTSIRFSSVLNSIIYLNDMSNSVVELNNTLEAYLADPSEKNYNQYSQRLSTLYSYVAGKGIEAIDERYALNFYKILRMVNSYTEEADAAVWSNRARDYEKYIYHFNEADKIAGFIDEHMRTLIFAQLNQSNELYRGLRERIKYAEILTVISILSAALFSVIFALWSTKNIVRPINRLVGAAGKISQGDFEIEQIDNTGEEEIDILGRTFYAMSSSIKRLVEDIKDKAEIEVELHKQEAENLRISGLLREAELKTLQSQINPHFLFNTLSTVAQTAMLEGADRTCSLIESVADLLRYNLRKIDRPVTLQEEIDNLKEYINIQKARFGERVQIEMNIDERGLELAVPSLILQPIVENAFIHGVERKEGRGIITINIAKKSDRVEVEVSDNGPGMNKETIGKILECSRKNNCKGIKETGIGMENVIKRLRIFYGIEDVIRIDSEEGKGTRVVLLLPAITI
ncbi:MAG: integral rane sensor signal transduction histidine kinase [Clostridia bacterium]|nr:integral rane sensor signal transduction histidine kinase [Clostridia bacterium]